jgi:hypothetical protein
MSYQAPLPNTGVLLPVLGSGQAWEGSVYNGNFTGVENAIAADRSRLSSIEGKIGSNAVIPAGTSAARDGFYGVPASAAARVALANAVPRWFNTDKGWEEQYFATEGDAGAGRFTRQFGGWYPSVTSGRVPLSIFTTANSGGTVTRDGGSVTINGACNTIAFNNVFTTDFLDYEFEIEVFGTAADLLWRSRLAGADDSTSIYNRNRFTSNSNSTSQSLAETAQNAGAAGRIDTADPGSILLRVRQPFIAGSKTATRGHGLDSGNYQQITSSFKTAAASHDGITFFVAAGSFQGRIKAFGINPF